MSTLPSAIVHVDDHGIPGQFHGETSLLAAAPWDHDGQTYGVVSIDKGVVLGSDGYYSGGRPGVGGVVVIPPGQELLTAAKLGDSLRGLPLGDDNRTIVSTVNDLKIAAGVLGISNDLIAALIRTMIAAPANS